MANAPRDDGTLDFHVRMVDGGSLSPVLTWRVQPGSRVRLGPPVGTLTLQDAPQRDIVMVAGSTGLAPLKAIIDQLSRMPAPPRVHLFFGARTADGLYDLPSLEKMAAEYGWLTVTHAVSDDPGDRVYAGERGVITDVMSQHGSWHGHDAYVCGSAAMVEAAVDRLGLLGVPPEQVHVEDFGWSS
jgi:NAD(P)H-flavin reductase